MIGYVALVKFIEFPMTHHDIHCILKILIQSNEQIVHFKEAKPWLVPGAKGLECHEKSWDPTNGISRYCNEVILG